MKSISYKFEIRISKSEINLSRAKSRDTNVQNTKFKTRFFAALRMTKKSEIATAAVGGLTMTFLIVSSAAPSTALRAKGCLGMTRSNGIASVCEAGVAMRMTYVEL